MPLTVRHVRDPPLTAFQSTTKTTIAELSAWVVMLSEGAPDPVPLSVAVEAPIPSEPRKVRRLPPQSVTNPATRVKVGWNVCPPTTVAENRRAQECCESPAAGLVCWVL